MSVNGTDHTGCQLVKHKESQKCPVSAIHSPWHFEILHGSRLTMSQACEYDGPIYWHLE